MTDPTPQTPAPASAAEVLSLLASYAEAARIAADPEEPAANNHMARMAEDSLRRRLLALSPAHLRALAAAQPASAPADAGLREAAGALEEYIRTNVMPYAIQGGSHRVIHDRLGGALNRFRRTLLAQHPTPPAGAGAEAEGGES